MTIQECARRGAESAAGLTLGTGVNRNRYVDPDGVTFDRVTACLKGSFEEWYAEQERAWMLGVAADAFDEYVKEAEALWPDVNGWDFRKVMERRVAEQPWAATAVRDAAGDVGTEAHELILSLWMNGSDPAAALVEGDYDPAVENIVRRFFRWLEFPTDAAGRTLKIDRPHQIEQTVADREHRYAGTYDALCLVSVNGGPAWPAIVDLKTSGTGAPRYYPNQPPQLAAYARIVGAEHTLIVSCPKPDEDGFGGCGALYTDPAGVAEDFAAFLAALANYRHTLSTARAITARKKGAKK